MHHVPSSGPRWQSKDIVSDTMAKEGENDIESLKVSGAYVLLLIFETDLPKANSNNIGKSRLSPQERLSSRYISPLRPLRMSKGMSHSNLVSHSNFS